MDRELKYIIVLDTGLEMPILFPMIVTHSDVASELGRVVGAGFCRLFEDGKWNVWGGSTSLLIPSRGKEDADIINKHFCRTD
jgi:hypothetical protein